MPPTIRFFYGYIPCLGEFEGGPGDGGVVAKQHREIANYPPLLCMNFVTSSRKLRRSFSSASISTIFA